MWLVTLWQFIFSSFWIWFGTLVLLGAIVAGFVRLIWALKATKRVREGIDDDGNPYKEVDEV